MRKALRPKPHLTGITVYIRLFFPPSVLLTSVFNRDKRWAQNVFIEPGGGVCICKNIMKISLMSWFHLKAGRSVMLTWLLGDGVEQGKRLFAQWYSFHVQGMNSTQALVLKILNLFLLAALGGRKSYTLDSPASHTARFPSLLSSDKASDVFDLLLFCLLQRCTC